MLEVPGAKLYYEVTGAGPVLLLIPGGPAGGAVFSGLVPILAEYYTVLTYDPRGISRSVVDDRALVISVEQQAEDASRLLDAVGGGPALVFGSSGGAVTGLALVTARPSLVSTLVAHEPPVIQLLPDAAERIVAAERVYQTYREQGVEPAMGLFMAGAGFGGPAAEPHAAAGLAATPAVGADAGGRGQAMPPGMVANLELFLGEMALPITTYRPDTAALRSASSRVVLGAGATSAGQTAWLATAALAAELGTELTVFPGGHGGFGEESEAFAHLLRETLGGPPISAPHSPGRSA